MTLVRPEFTKEEAEAVRLEFEEKFTRFMEHGLDVLRSREAMVWDSGPLSGQVLEIGTGAGHTTIALARAGYEVVTVDPDGGMLRRAAMNLDREGLLDRVSFRAADGRVTGLEAASFGNVFCVCLLHHVKDTAALFSEIDRVLAPGGLAVFADFNRKGMDLMAELHRRDGRSHEDSGSSAEGAADWLSGRKYEVRRDGDVFHWIVRARKAASG